MSDTPSSCIVEIVSMRHGGPHHSSGSETITIFDVLCEVVLQIVLIYRNQRVVWVITSTHVKLVFVTQKLNFSAVCR